MSMIKASKDYIKLRKLLNDGHRPTTINIRLDEGNEKAILTLMSKNSNSVVFESGADDVIKFSFSLKSLFDQHGNSLFGEVKDLNKFYDEAKMLTDLDNKKFHAARNRILQGKVKIEYFPHLLFRQFLEETSPSNYKPYLKLKEDYFYIKVFYIEEMRMIYEETGKIRKQQSPKTILLNLISDLFKDAFNQNPNFLINYKLFQKFNKADVMDILISTDKDKKITDNLFEMLYKRGGVPAEEGLSHIVSTYASMAETINKLLNIIRGAIELVEGNTNPDVNKRSVENWLIIQEHQKYSMIVEDFDPRIRHGKAHNNFDIDTDKNIINFYKEGRIKELAVSYSFDQIRTMWHRIHIILSALIIAVCLEQSALTGVILNSTEYKLTLLRLGNFKLIK